MRLERVRRWQWVVLSLVVGVALAQARWVDHDDLPAGLGEGVADRQWFEQEVRRRVALADGSTVPVFGRLRVYPLSVRERGGRRPVHVVAGRYLARVGDGKGGAGGADAPDGSGAVGKLRPYFFIAPVPYQSLADERAGKPVDAGATVRGYLDRLRGEGVTYTYAWWADPRYAAAAWTGGSFVLIGLLWPTALNLLVHGSFRAQREERGVSLWQVKGMKPPHEPPRPGPTAIVSGLPEAAGPGPQGSGSSPLAGGPPRVPDAPRAAVPVLSTGPSDTALAAAAEHDPKEFGARRDDFYPTELKVVARHTDSVR